MMKVNQSGAIGQQCSGRNSYERVGNIIDWTLDTVFELIERTKTKNHNEPWPVNLFSVLFFWADPSASDVIKHWNEEIPKINHNKIIRVIFDNFRL